MQNQLFKNVNYKADPHWIVKEFFNSIYQQDRFLWALPLIVGKMGCGVNEEFCFFPDPNDPDPVYHFSGVTFGAAGEEVVITDEECSFYLREACDRYLEENSDDRIRINRIFEEN